MTNDRLRAYAIAMRIFLALLFFLIASPVSATPLEDYIVLKLRPEVGLLRAESIAKSQAPLIRRVAFRHHLSAALLASMVWHESNFDSACESPAGALGLLQVMPVHWKSYGYGSLLKNKAWASHPEVQLELGCRVLNQYCKYVQKRFPGLNEAEAWHYILRAYNMGPRYVSRGASRYSRAILRDAKNLTKN